MLGFPSLVPLNERNFRKTKYLSVKKEVVTLDELVFLGLQLSLMDNLLSFVLLSVSNNVMRLVGLPT